METQLPGPDVCEGPSKDFVPHGLGACLLAVGLCSLDRRVSPAWTSSGHDKRTPEYLTSWEKPGFYFTYMNYDRLVANTVVRCNGAYTSLLLNDLYNSHGI